MSYHLVIVVMLVLVLQGRKELVVSQKKRSVLQVREKGAGKDNRFYNPNRDIAWLYAPAMKEAIFALDECNWTSGIRAIIEATGITEDDISEAVAALVKAHVLFTNVRSVSTPEDALVTAGFFQCKPAARYLITGRLGEVMLGGFFVAVRDVTHAGQEPPMSRDIAEFVAAGIGVRDRCSGSVVDELDNNYDVLQERLLAAITECSMVRQALMEKDIQAKQVSADLIDRCNALSEELRKLHGRGFWSTIWSVLSKLKRRWIQRA